MLCFHSDGNIRMLAGRTVNTGPGVQASRLTHSVALLRLQGTATNDLMSEVNKPVNITSVLHESRVFKPRKEFAQNARINSLAQYRKLYNQSIKAPEKFWADQARNELVWFKPWKKVLQWKEPFAQWFVGGRLNVSYNCLDKWLDTPTANRAALIWEGEPATDGK